MKLSSSNIKKFLHFLKRKLFLYFIKRKRFLYFRKWNLHFSAQAQRIKKSTSRKFHIFQETKTRKNFLYFLKRRLFFYFRKRKPRNGNSKKLLIFQEITCKARKTNKKVCFEEIPCLLWRFCNFYISRAYTNSL